MAKETKSKEVQLTAYYDVNESITKDSSKKRSLFVMRYWFDKIVYLNETNERFRFLPKDSNLRIQCENILNTHKLDNSIVRFEESLVYVHLVSKGS